jgi:peptide/nickel transport system permease protein
LALLAVLLALTFLAVDALPSDAARATLDPEASSAEVAARRVQLGLDQPVVVRFVHWMGGLVQSDLGVTARGRPVWDVVGQPFGNTLILGGLALALTLVVSLALGGAAVLQPGSLLDRTVSSSATMLLALTEFVVAIALIVVLALWLPLLPAVTPASSDGLTTSAQTLVLPVLALALPQIGWNTRIVRAALAEQLHAPHVDSAILDGLSRRRILLHYLLPGAVPTIAGGAATSVGMVLGGTVTIEAIFNFPGIGSVLTGAIRDRDTTLVAGVVALSGLAITVVLVLSDLLRAWAVGRKP